jgi:OPT oligopeptide transporter protein
VNKSVDRDLHIRLYAMNSAVEAAEGDPWTTPRRPCVPCILPGDPLAADPTAPEQCSEDQQLTARSVAVGLAIGTLACFSNMYFGLQTGWISMMSLPLSLLGFAVFRALGTHVAPPFTPVENVFVQTVAVAVGTMPLAAGLVGVIPALEDLLRPEEGAPLRLNLWMLIVWSIGVAFFGVVFAVPLRRQVIVKEKYMLLTAVTDCAKTSVSEWTCYCYRHLGIAQQDSNRPASRRIMER